MEPLAVPEKIIGLTLFLDFLDRGAIKLWNPLRQGRGDRMVPLAVTGIFVGGGAPSSSADCCAINHFTSSATGGVK